MKILIAGNLGYIGPSLTEQLRGSFPNAELIGFDIGYFAHNLSNAAILPEVRLDQQIFGDIRNFPEELLTDVDAVVDLAAISNDPMGKEFEEVTMEVNYRAAVRLAEMCKRKGVKNFAFASSCSVYGTAGGAPKKEGDELNPLTAYARSKAAAEKELRPLADEDFTVTCFRFATACGFTSRLRLDLVLNDFVAGGMINRHIDILSDGTPWRPLIDTKDMARALEWGVVRTPETGGPFLVVNGGSNEWNFQIRPLAEAVAAQMPGVKVSVNQDAEPDKRTYQINFDLFEQLAPDYQPMYDLKQTICEMRNHLEVMEFHDSNFRDSEYIRLKSLRHLCETGLLNGNLEWIQAKEQA
jgi:nucleoside-diphosphate-sugar epimerase